MHTDAPTDAPARQELDRYAPSRMASRWSRRARCSPGWTGATRRRFRHRPAMSGGQLSFTVNAGRRRDGLKAMLPVHGPRSLSALARNGLAVSPFASQTIKGINYAILRTPQAPTSRPTRRRRPARAPGARPCRHEQQGSGSGASEDAGQPHQPGGGTTNPPGGGTTTPRRRHHQRPAAGPPTRPAAARPTRPAAPPPTRRRHHQPRRRHHNGRYRGQRRPHRHRRDRRRHLQRGRLRPDLHARQDHDAALPAPDGERIQARVEAEFALTFRLKHDSRVVLTFRDARGKSSGTSV